MQRRTRVWILFAACLAIVAVSAQRPAEFDLIVRNGTLIDGSGAGGARADVAVKDGRIVRVGRLQDASAATELDVAGLVVAPGFIDVHTHADDTPGAPAAENFVRMGVTSVIAGNCGGSASRIGEALARVRSAGAPVNFGTLIGHNTIRQAVMGADQRRSPTSGELEKMTALVAAAMAEGAFGLSTGLQYVPGAYSEAPEIVELARVAAAAGGLYASHMRNEGSEIEKAVGEAIGISEAAGCPVQISHVKIDSPNRWGASRTIIDMMEAARRRGVEVGGDQYAYTAAASSLSIRFPAWALEGGRAKVAARLEDEATWQRIKADMKDLLAERGLQDLSFAVVTSYRANPSLNGLSMKQIAQKLQNVDDAAAQLETARNMMLDGGASMVYHFMSEDDITRIMRHPDIAVASDSDILSPGAGVPHPRGYGNNARVLGRYVRELNVITLEEAIRKMTSLPASQFRLADRGLVREGFAADLVVFDPATVADRATYEQPRQFPVGIPYVIINGVVVVRDGETTGARPGQVLARIPPRPRGTVGERWPLSPPGR